MKECMNCKTMLEDDELFCHECGTKQEIEDIENQVEEPVTSNEKYCVHCGEAIEADSMFCPFCGKPQEVEGEEEEPQPSTAEPDPQQEPEETQQPQAEERNNAASIRPEQSEQPKRPEQPEKHQTKERPTNEWKEEETSSKKRLWILMAVLIVGGLGVWFSMSDGNDNPTADYVEETDPTATMEHIETAEIHSIEGVKSRLIQILSMGMKMADDEAVKKYFSKDYQETFFKVEEYDNKNIPEGEIGFWDFSIWGDGQGGLGDFHSEIKDVQNITEKSVSVIVDYVSDEIKGEKLTTKFDLCFENGNWFIDEIIDDNGLVYKNSMKEYLNDINAKPLLSIENLRNTDLDNAIKAQEFNKKSISIRRGYVTDIWYKNCDIDNNGKIKTNNSNSCIVEVFDGMSASVRITVFEKNRYEQIKEEVVKYSVNKGNSYYFRWNDNETTEMSISMGVGDFIEGGYYIDIPLF